MTIAVDFDGTIVQHRYPMIGKPLPHAFDVLRALQRQGHKIILWTNREGPALTEAVDFCRQNGLEFYAINSMTPEDTPVLPGCELPRKINADLYIDDHNIGGLPQWREIYNLVSRESALKKNKSKDNGSEHHRSAHHHHRHHHHGNSFTDFFKDFAARCRAAHQGFKI